jgi:hypothetical protein
MANPTLAARTKARQGWGTQICFNQKGPDRARRRASPTAWRFPLEGKRCGVDAIAQAGGAGTIREDVAQVAAATGASNLDAAPSQAQILVLVDDFGAYGNGEAGPAAAGVEFSSAEEEQRSAAGAVVVAGLMVFGEGVRWLFRAGFDIARE